MIEYIDSVYGDGGGFFGGFLDLFLSQGRVV